MAFTVLRARLDGYSYQVNDRVGASIREELLHGTVVEIHGARREGSDREALKGEESELIALLKPAWNVQP